MTSNAKPLISRLAKTQKMSEDNSDGQLEDEFEKDLDDLDEDEEDSSEEE
jgi:hypothetical protein